MFEIESQYKVFGESIVEFLRPLLHLTFFMIKHE